MLSSRTPFQTMFASLFLIGSIISVGAVMCPAPRSPDGGQAFLLGSRVVEFACGPSFQLVGPRRVMCLDSGEWERPFPVCATAPERRALFDWGQEDNSTLTAQRLKDEQRKRAGVSPSVIYVRRPLGPQNDKGDDYLRRLYYHNNYYYQQQQYQQQYQQQPLSESQMAWILSLPPELRDQYLRDMLRPYDYYDQRMMYLRQPLTPRELDYSCNRAGTPFVAAPRVANARVARYDRRQSSSRNHYLAVVYRCDPGYSLADRRHSELYCSGARWVGPRPICLPN